MVVLAILLGAAAAVALVFLGIFIVMGAAWLIMSSF